VAGKLIAAAVAVLICISPAYASPKDTADQAENGMPKVSAKYYEAYDITSEQELLGSRENQKMYPASITKVLFARTLLDRIREEDKTPSDTAGTVTSKDNEKAAAAGLYRSGIRGGEKVTWNDLLHSITYMSGAEACYAAARIAFGNESRAVAEMNRKARSLGMKNSHFVNITGAHRADHYTTCSDFVKVMQDAWGDETLSGIFSAQSYTTSDKKHRFVSPTVRAADSGGSELIGGKTGTTNAAQHTFAGFMNIKNHIVVIIVGLCPLRIPSSNIRDAGTIASFVRNSFTLRNIPEFIEKDGFIYTPQSKGSLLMRNGRCRSFISGGNLVMESGDQKSVIPATRRKAGTKDKDIKASNKSSRRNESAFSLLLKGLEAVRDFLVRIIFGTQKA
jgi:D-alanyl-D-alanine carboxypeptidase